MRREGTKSNAFDAVPRTPAGDFRIYFYAAILRLLDYLRRLSGNSEKNLDQTFETYPFLAAHFKEITLYLPPGITWESAPIWWRTQSAFWRQKSEKRLPLENLAREGRFHDDHVVAAMVVGLVEEDSRFGTLYSDMHGPLGFRRPSIELVERIMTGPVAYGNLREMCGSLLDGGVLEVVNKDHPRSEWALRVPPVLWNVMRGGIGPRPSSWCQYLDSGQFPSIDQLIFPEYFLQRLQQVPALLKDREAGSIVLRGTLGSDRLRTAEALARAMGANIIRLEGEKNGEKESRELLGVLCSMTGSVPLITRDLDPGETAEIGLLKGYRGPFIVLTGYEGGLTGQAVEKAASLTLPRLDAPLRKRCWQEALAGRAVEEIDLVSRRFFIPGGYIRRAASLATAHAALENRQVIGVQDVRRACRGLNRQLLDTLADRLEIGGQWDQLVVNFETREKLLEVEQRCRFREDLNRNLGPAFGSVPNTGVRALFSGASGTGKTLAAKILAAELEMDLYRVDLAAVVNKYIGETEKNLHRVLSRAEEMDVILLLDEGDALLGSRTEVKTANDRYANLETDYLLQKLEHYQGIVLITTNAVENIDRAFQRRMDAAVNFIPPGEAERLQIWRLHLPEGHGVENDFLEDVSRRCIITGGQIRNAALHAALLSLDDDSRTVTTRHLEEALHSEYRKAGALFPLRDEKTAVENKSGMDAFFKGWVS